MGWITRLTQKGKTLTREQQIASVLLVFLGLGGVVLGSLSFGAMIRRPFEIQLAKYAKSGEYLSVSQKEEKAKEEQKTKDTDGDGLSDYDELYIYKTSPYIKDTDSDGTDDKTEVFAGNNPNCPEGKSCSGVTGDAAGANTAATNLLGVISNSPIASSLSKYNFQSKDDIDKFVKSITVDQIRQALTQAGVPADQLDSITDEQLKQLFSQTLGEASASGELTGLIEQAGGTDAGTSTDASGTSSSTSQTSPTSSP